MADTYEDQGKDIQYAKSIDKQVFDCATQQPYPWRRPDGTEHELRQSVKTRPCEYPPVLMIYMEPNSMMLSGLVPSAPTSRSCHMATHAPLQSPSTMHDNVKESPRKERVPHDGRSKRCCHPMLRKSISQRPLLCMREVLTVTSARALMSLIVALLEIRW